MGTIGVTGHRQLRDPAAVAAAVDEAFDRAIAFTGWMEATILTLVAEGADRVVAERALARRWPVAIVLPLDAGDYEADFADPESVAAFRDLIGRATRVQTSPPQPTRTEAYLAAGLTMLERSDIVLAVWDGAPGNGPGGTADIVARARASELPLIWICEREDGTVTVEGERFERLAR